MLLAVGCLALAVKTTAESPSSTNQSVRFPALAVKDEHGQSLAVFSLEAYRAEFRFLAKLFHKTDLTGQPVITDGWNYNIAEAEWPFMGFCYLGYACGNLAQFDPPSRSAALEEMRWLIEALQTPRMSGFETAHFEPPFATNKINVAVFVHGHFLNLAMRYREVSGDSRYDVLIHRVAEALVREYMAVDQGVLRSYKDMWWITDNFPAIAALARYDRVFHRDTSAARNKFLSSLKEFYLDYKTGLVCTYINPVGHVQAQGPRGVSVMYGLHFLKDMDAGLAASQYRQAKRFLIQEVLGMSVVREFPEGSPLKPDIDSGPVILGAGPSASGFAIAAAAINGDTNTAWGLLKASAMVGMPVLANGELQYLSMPPVGQAVILFGKTELLKQ